MSTLLGLVLALLAAAPAFAVVVPLAIPAVDGAAAVADVGMPIIPDATSTSLPQVARRHWPWVASTALAVVLLLLAVARGVALNRRLARSGRALEGEIRERERAQDEIARAYAELEERVQERTNELTAVIETLQDEIGERERAEELLTQSEERARAVVDASLDGVITMDEQGFIESVNPAAERMFGWSVDELAGRNARVLTTEPSDPADGGPLQRTALRDERIPGGLEGEVIGRRKDGSRLPVEVALSEMRLGTRRLLLCTLRDVTQRRRDEERVAKMQDELHRQQVMASIGTLAAGFAHEARNPLFGISATLDAFGARFGESGGHEEYVRRLRSEVGRLNQLMRDLLEYGRSPTPLRAGTLGHVVGEAVAACRPHAEAASVALDVRLGDDASQRLAMNERLVLVFQNLLLNAIQFSPAGGSVVLETRAGVPNGDGRAPLEVSVSDSGPGLREEDLPRLFEPFFTRRRGGTGLGLAIVRRIVEEHRGSIAATNHPGGGAVVVVRLPPEDAPATESEHEHAP